MAKKSVARKSRPKAGSEAGLTGAAEAAQSIARALSTGRRSKDGLTVHIHVGDLFLMGFDEAIDAEEWGAREIGDSGGGKGSEDAAIAKAEASMKTRKRLNFRKGEVRISAMEDSEPGKAKRARKTASRKTASRKTAARKTKRRTTRRKTR